MGATSYIAQYGVATEWEQHRILRSAVSRPRGATTYIAQCGEYQKQDTCVPTGRDKKKQLKVVLLIACNYSLKFLVNSKCEIHKFSNSQILDK